MKNFKYLLSAVAVASALTACSSMDVDDEEALAGNFPEDFSDSVYLNLHPELVRVQRKEYVAAYNTKQADSVKAYVEAETAKCLGNADCVAKANAVQTEYNAMVEAATATLKTKKAYQSAITEIDATTKEMYHKILVDPLLGGFTEADWQADPQSDRYYAALRDLNFYDAANDYEVLKNIPIDTFAISYQYVIYGRDYGWAYRRCSATEAANPVKTESYPATKLYCADDNGIAHEIK